MTEIILKKRGRKPKNKSVEINTISININSDEDAIIAHLPISLDDIVNNSDNLVDTTYDNDDIFIKSNKNSKIINEEILLNQINQKILETDRFFTLGKNINKVNVHNIKYKTGSKCLWCKYSFITPPVQLPEYYYNEIFICSGNFCSWECMRAHNIDTDDFSVWKRESLINLMYYKTYGIFKDINVAPHWHMLEDFGGDLTITEFRNLFTFNNKEYLILHPPLITRQLQIEESYKKSSPSNMSNMTPLESDFTLKRNKPIESSINNLEKTMGLKIKSTIKIKK
jgi:hypothetical protein